VESLLDSLLESLLLLHNLPLFLLQSHLDSQLLCPLVSSSVPTPRPVLLPQNQQDPLLTPQHHRHLKHLLKFQVVNPPDNPLESQVDNPLENPLHSLLGNPLESQVDNHLVNHQGSQVGNRLANPLESQVDNPLENLLHSLLGNPLESRVRNRLVNHQGSQLDDHLGNPLLNRVPILLAFLPLSQPCSPPLPLDFPLRVHHRFRHLNQLLSPPRLCNQPPVQHQCPPLPRLRDRLLPQL
jgi:hypothetical protein